MILADSSIWIDFFRDGNAAMQQYLDAQEILMHPYVLLELSLGSLKDRSATLLELSLMNPCQAATESEVRQMIEARALYSRGIGFVDVHLIASCLLTRGTRLWTRDSRLLNAATVVGVPVLP